MKTSSLVALALSLGLTATSFAGTVDSAAKEPVITPPPPESDSGPFIGFVGGEFWMKNFTAGDPLKVDFKFKSGESFTMPIGYEFGNGLSFSFSAGYDRADFRQLTGELGGDIQKASVRGGHVAFVPLMANACYSLKLVGKLSWYIGAGIGAVHENSTFRSYDNDHDRSITFGRLGGSTAFFDGLTNNSWNFGYQAFTGLSYEVCPHASIKVGYRFTGVDSHVTVNGDSGRRLEGQTAEAGVIWKF
jgi:opacity protein-like surface antigen